MKQAGHTVAGKFGRTSVALALVLGGTAGVPLAAQAAPAPLQISEVRDSDLAGMRGRYLNANQVVYFGVEMVSQWQTADGKLLQAGLDLNVDLRHGGANPAVSFRPVVTIAALTTRNDVAGSGSRVVAGGGLGNATGVVQGIQVAGDGNQVRNDIRMSVTRDDNPSAPAGDAGGGNVATASDGHGAVTIAQAGGNALGVIIDIPGQGRVIQQIRGANAGGGFGIVQTAQVASDMNRIQNVLRLTADLRAMTVSPALNVGAALQTLRGIPVAGQP